MSSSGRSFMGGVLPPANPPPAYIGQTAAEHLTSTELERPVNVSANALELVNGFLDQVLYNILSISKSTRLDVLRQTVPRLLKPRLGHAAISAAEEELRDYLEAEDPNSLQEPPKLSKPSDFDLELAWKLARLRCMVYAQLGDMEDEDEEEYLESERLEEHVHNSPMSVVPISAIFLTSVLEFLGEQALCNAAQHAEKRHNFEISRSASSGRHVRIEEDHLVVDQADMLQLGREGPLSRLWRTWRRESRSSDTFTGRPITRDSMASPTITETSHSRKPSHASPTHAILEEDSPKSEAMTPAQIPLPMGESDIDEIEVPGYSQFSRGVKSDRQQSRFGMGPRRPSSLLIMPGDFPSSPRAESPEVPTRSPLRPHYSRTRSRSLPGPWENDQFVNTWRSDHLAAIASEQPSRYSGKTPLAGDERANLELEPSTDEVSRPQTRGSSRAGAINGAAVAAIAGALGVEAARSRKDRGSKDVPRPETPRNRTVAEEMLEPARNVAAPYHAGTRASMTRPSDFEGAYVPQGLRIVESDPEDLALSSGDERNAGANRRRDSGFDAHESPVATSSPASPRRNREAAVYENSIVSSPRERQHEFRDDLEDDYERPGTRESITFEPSTLAQTSTQRHADVSARYSQNSDLPLHRPEEFESVGNTPVLSNGAWTTSIPPRMSSRDQPRSGHIATGSKSSQYSSHSKRSSAAGQSLNDQRADFERSPHSRNTSTNTQRVIPGPVVGSSPKQPLSTRREHLRVRADSEEDAARIRNLEVLIKSDETLHYTLTPESARGEEFPQSTTKPKTETQDLADFFRTTAPPGEKAVSGHVRSAKHSFNGLRSNPTGSSPRSSGVADTSRFEQAQPAELSVGPNSPQRSPQQPRDPRPERNTTRDLADYMRSTGPMNEYQLPQALAPHAEDTPKEAVSNARSGSVPRAPHSERAQAARNANRLKFQARDARPQPGSETADLIDFIRQGPPRVAGEHRIDRKVAPFRTTMDSDDLQALGPFSELPGRDSVGSNHESAATKSMQESTNSRTGLLDASRQNNMRTTAPPINHDVKRQVIPEQDGMPPRTRRRVKDPYAIDFSDDEDFEEEIAASKPRKEEESLIDFLRNTAPPPGRTAQPIVSASAAPQQQPDLNRSASSTKLRNVLSRSGSSKKRVVPSTNGAREEPPHLPAKTTPRQTALGGNKPRYQAREAKTSVTSTSDLADYLLNSGPPESTNSMSNTADPPMIRSDVKEQAGFMKFFSRRASVRR